MTLVNTDFSPRQYEHLYCTASGLDWRCERAWVNQEHFLCDVHRGQLTRGTGALKKLRRDSRVKPPKPCTFLDCPRPGVGPTSLCETHQNQKRSGRELTAVHPPIRRDQPCKASGPGWECDEFENHRTGLCSFHQRQKLHNARGFTAKKIRSREEVTARDEEGRKKCNRCETWKDASDFYTSKNTSDGLQPDCKECYRDRNLQRRFKITLSEYGDMLKGQGGVCAICGNSDTRSLSVDHDHSCCPGDRSCGSCIRGLLCGECNTGLGRFKDNVATMRRAIQYLEEHK